VDGVLLEESVAETTTVGSRVAGVDVGVDDWLGDNISGKEVLDVVGVTVGVATGVATAMETGLL